MNPLEALVQQLSRQSGPRGSTFAGRVVPQGESPNLPDLLRMPQQAPIEGEGYGMPLIGAAGMIKTALGKPIRDEAIHAMAAADPANAAMRMIKVGTSPQELAYLESLIKSLSGKVDRYIMPEMRKRALEAANKIK